jgi:hypothetical protein
LISCSSGNRLEDLVEIAFRPRTDSGSNRPRWDTVNWGVVMENGWTRYDISPPLASSNIVQSVSLRSSDAVAKTAISLSVWHLDGFGPTHWLSQANHIFKHLGISSKFEDYDTRFTAIWSLQAMSNQASLGPTQAWGCWPYWGQISGLKPSPWLQPYQLVATTLPYMDVSIVV